MIIVFSMLLLSIIVRRELLSESEELDHIEKGLIEEINKFEEYLAKCKNEENSISEKLENIEFYGNAALFTVSSLLQLSGFGPSGILSRSLAAKMQSRIGNVAKGSIFSRIQSLGARGTLMKGIEHGKKGIIKKFYNDFMNFTCSYFKNSK